MYEGATARDKICSEEQIMKIGGKVSPKPSPQRDGVE